MSKNIEIKANYPNLKKAGMLAERLNAQKIGSDHQVDTFFNVPKGRLKLRESSLNGNFLIPYFRSNQKEATDSQYVLLPVEEVLTTKFLLKKMFGILLIVEKVRRIYLYKNVRIHLDDVRNLGTFIEFEAILKKEYSKEKSSELLKELIRYFGVNEFDLVAVAYADLLTAQKK